LLSFMFIHRKETVVRLPVTHIQLYCLMAIEVAWKVTRINYCILSYETTW
jgi:hypothetical protein